MILIGFMGAGKTTVGKALASQWGLELLDTDQLIEEDAGMTISQIFAEQGEDVFRETETRMLKKLLGRDGQAVISAGGGLPLREENQRLLRELGTVVYLQVQPDTVLERLKGDTTRPLLQGGDAREKVTSLLAYRSPIYAKAAHMTVDVDGRLPVDVAADIMEKVTRSEAIGGAVASSTDDNAV